MELFFQEGLLFRIPSEASLRIAGVQQFCQVMALVSMFEKVAFVTWAGFTDTPTDTLFFSSGGPAEQPPNWTTATATATTTTTGTSTLTSFFF